MGTMKSEACLYRHCRTLNSRYPVVHLALFTWSDATVCSQFPTWAAWAHELKAKQKQQTLVLAPGCSVSISVRQNPASEDGMRALRSLCIALFGDDVVFHAVPVQIKILRCQAVSTSRRHRYLKHLLRLLQLKPQP